MWKSSRHRANKITISFDCEVRRKQGAIFVRKECQKRVESAMAPRVFWQNQVHTVNNIISEGNHS